MSNHTTCYCFAQVDLVPSLRRDKGLQASSEFELSMEFDRSASLRCLYIC